MEMGLVLLSLCFVVEREGVGLTSFSCHNYACKAALCFLSLSGWVGDLFMARHPPLIRETK